MKWLIYLIIGIGMIGMVNAYSNSTGLVAQYSCENNTLDTATGLYNGTSSSQTYTGGIIGVGCKYTGADTTGYFTINDADALDLNSSQTICVWINRSKVGTRQNMISKYHTTGNQRGYLFEVSSTTNNINLFLGTNTGTSYTASDTATAEVSATNTWYFLCEAWNKDLNAGNMSIYKNGVEANYTGAASGLGVKTTQIVSTTEVITVGKSGYTTGRAVNGTLDEITLWNRKLSPTEINLLYTDYLIGIRPTDINITSNQCIYSGTGDFNITNQVCNVTSNYNLLGNNAYWSNVTMINNGSISNYTIWWESGTIIEQ